MSEQNLTVPQAFQIAHEKLWNGDVPAAEHLYREILRVQPGHLDAHIGLASLLFVSGRESDGLAMITDVLKRSPTSAKAYAQRDRMNYVQARAADTKVQQERSEMRATMAAMEAELRLKEIYVPSRFWSTLGALHSGLLELYGVENFKRTVTHHYQNWSIMTMDEPMMKRLLELWQVHFSSKPLSATMEKPNDVGIHYNLRLPFYDLAIGQHSEIYKLAASLLWEYTRATDKFHLLDTLEESPIGAPLNVRQEGKLISSDLCHSLRERNQMLEIGGLTGSEGLVVGELGGGSGRLAEMFGLTTNYKYVIFDITPALYVSQWYIKNRFPDEKRFEFRHFEKFQDIETELSESRFAFFTANQIELFPPQYFDQFVNINSLMEMDHPQRMNFLDQIDRVTRSHFFSQQWFRWTNDADKILVTKADFNLAAGWKIEFESANVINPELFVQSWTRINRT